MTIRDAVLIAVRMAESRRGTDEGEALVLVLQTLKAENVALERISDRLREAEPC